MEHAPPLADVEYLPLDDAVKEYGVPKTTLWRHFKRGLVEGMKVAGRIHLRRTSLDELLLSGANLSRSTSSRPPWNGTWNPETRVDRIAGNEPHASHDDHSQAPDSTSHPHQHSTPSGTLHSIPDETSRSIPHHSTRGTEAEQPFPRRSTVPSGTVREIHELALRLDDLHQELRRTERDNAGLRFELQRYRTALEENAASILEREARARHAETLLAQHDTELTRRLDTEIQARQQAAAELETLRLAREAAAAQLQATQEELLQAQETSLRVAEEARSASRELTALQTRYEAETATTREQVELAAWRAEQATAQADSAQSTIAALRELLEAEKAQPWWRRLFKR